jgi:hypothetical protein
MFTRSFVIRNFENAEYLKINGKIIVTAIGETHTVSSLAEIDYLNDKVQINTVSDISPTLHYYRKGNVIYKDFTGEWQVETVEKPEDSVSSVEVINRLRRIDKWGYIRTEKLNGIDSYLLKSDMTKEETLALLNNLFKNTLSGVSGQFNIKSAETLWWINEENKQLSLDIRTINAEIGGYPIKLVMESSYFDYNKPINIEVPNNLD